MLKRKDRPFDLGVAPNKKRSVTDELVISLSGLKLGSSGSTLEFDVPSLGEGEESELVEFFSKLQFGLCGTKPLLEHRPAHPHRKPRRQNKVLVKYRSGMPQHYTLYKSPPLVFTLSVVNSHNETKNYRLIVDLGDNQSTTFENDDDLSTAITPYIN